MKTKTTEAYEIRLSQKEHVFFTVSSDNFSECEQIALSKIEKERGIEGVGGCITMKAYAVSYMLDRTPVYDWIYTEPFPFRF